MITVKVTIKDSNGSWTEDFDIQDGADIETNCKTIIEHWNSRNDVKYHREHVSYLIEDKPYDFETMMKDAAKFMDYCHRQESNGYGNRGVKHSYKKIIASHKKFISGTYGNFISFVNEFKGYDYDNISKLYEVTKESYKELRKDYLKRTK